MNPTKVASHLSPLPQMSGILMGSMVQRSPFVSRQTAVEKVSEIFTQTNAQGIVIVDEMTPVGLLMKNKMHFHLSSKYGVSLYSRRPVELIMDKHPTIVESSLPLEQVSNYVFERMEEQLYDLIIVVDNGQYLGTVSIIQLLRQLTDLQIRYAAQANPLTGLPGNLMIEERLKQTVIKSVSSHFGVLYIDLDNFKAFNDKYGFEHGDKVIKFTADLLASCLLNFDPSFSISFLGHIGGDDFIIEIDGDNPEELAESITQEFDKGIHSFYATEDLERGCIKVYNRKGHLESFPIMSISIAIVHNRYRNFNNYLEIGEIAARIKKKAKKVCGSIWIVDQRKEKDKEEEEDKDFV
ncbi:MAG TPA: GGDEF domain-containing protein [Methylomusa anaerophila]|uniref:Cyclic di-GMP phosphodiesterase Gmr n=1 Tax=Methylomusa anaerophila TaxID=1930071 RepID=A0A348ALN0_9FIRM|nr:GGDEF domain-containing protein [Methylomusa anaerophila]BBB91978.1 cyclic di-GMP phosphodiesterase Gmr [Methylomusa anaerophila]HML88009.1 GGDEF domain-containing protein [Methylomusa anaerophila]